jgi:hypothetical protein
MFFDMDAPRPHVPIAQKLARKCRESKWVGALTAYAANDPQGATAQRRIATAAAANGRKTRACRPSASITANSDHGQTPMNLIQINFAGLGER